MTRPPVPTCVYPDPELQLVVRPVSDGEGLDGLHHPKRHSPDLPRVVIAISHRQTWVMVTRNIGTRDTRQTVNNDTTKNEPPT